MIVAAPRLVLNTLNDFRPILCIVKSRNRYGLALSNELLTNAYPLKDANHVSQVQDAIDVHGAGALAFAYPMKRTRVVIEPSRRLVLDHEQERSILLQHGWSVPVGFTLDDRLTVQEAAEEAQDKVEHWMHLDLERPELSVDAAVALNHFLWNYMGGLQSEALAI